MFEKKLVPKTEKKKTKPERGTGEKGKNILSLILLPAFLAIVLVAGVYLCMDKMTKDDKIYKDVVVAKEAVNENRYITKEEIPNYFKTVSLDSAAVSENALTKISDLGDGFYVTSDLEENEIIYESDIKTTDAALDKYLNGYQKTSVAVSNFDKGVNGALREGDIIDVYAVDPATDELTKYADSLYVEAAYDSSGALLTEADGVAQSYTVYVKEEEIPSLNQAIHYGEIQLYKK